MNASQDLILDVTQTIEIHAAIGDAFKALLKRMTTESSTTDNQPMPLVLEEWPGGRWFRDLGNGQGHLWGLVQVIKPPTIIEIQGPMFMSYPAAGHIQFRLTQISGGVELYMRHRVLGLIEADHRMRVEPGWESFISDVKKLSEPEENDA